MPTAAVTVSARFANAAPVSLVDWTAGRFLPDRSGPAVSTGAEVRLSHRHPRQDRLSGVYDFKIAFVGPFAPVEPAGGDPSLSPSLFTAIQDLGLKLEARKAPTKVLVIDHGEKLSEN